MFDLFSTSWSQLEIAHVQAFLDETTEEGVTWEAKGGGPDGRLRPEVIQRAACGLTNQLGGYLILGAYERANASARSWELLGLTVNDPEPKTWIERLLQDGLRPTPRFAVHTFPADGGRVVIVIRIEPVAEPPCMTRQGHIFERVSGETRAVTDPAVLAALLHRGDRARERAREEADATARHAVEELHWAERRSVSLAIAMAPVGRGSGDVAGRLFAPSFNEAARASLQAMLQVDPMRPTSGGSSYSQKTMIAYAHFDGQHGAPRLSKLLAGHWDGSVAAAAHYGPEMLPHVAAIENLILPGWRAIVPLVRQLGGYGPARLTVAIDVATVPGTAVVFGSRDVGGAAPESTSFFAAMPGRTRIRRDVDVREPADEQIANLRRELQRAAGQASFEPELEINT